MSDASDYVDAQCKVCGKYFDFCLITTSYEEAGLAMCSEGHKFCSEHAPKHHAQIIAQETDEDFDPTDVPCEECPICIQRRSKGFIKELSNEDLLLFLLIEQGLTEKSLKEKIKKRFKTGEEFFAFINK
jgi:hypothetical protein